MRRSDAACVRLRRPPGTWLLALLLLVASVGANAAAPAQFPTALRPQVQRLAELLSDGYAVLYPEGTKVQVVKLRSGQELVLTVFTLEGQGGGNSHSQYFAVFTPQPDRTGKPYFSLLDVILLGGKGWRGVANLNARVSSSPNGQEIRIDIDGAEVAGDDAPNFPSRKITIALRLIDGRLSEVRR